MPCTLGEGRKAHGGEFDIANYTDSRRDCQDSHGLLNAHHEDGEGKPSVKPKGAVTVDPEGLFPARL
jgi:hypothetical protein